MSDETTDRDALRALAAEATPGPWRFTDAEVVNDVWDAGLVIVDADQTAIAALHDEWYEPDDDELACVDDAAYIAAASPDVVLGLLDALDQAERERERLVSLTDRLAGRLAAAEAQVAAVRAVPAMSDEELIAALDTPAPVTRDADEDEREALAQRVIADVAQERLTHAQRGYGTAHDDEHGVEHLHEWAERYFVGRVDYEGIVKALSLILAASDARARRTQDGEDCGCHWVDGATYGDPDARVRVRCEKHERDAR